MPPCLACWPRRPGGPAHAAASAGSPPSHACGLCATCATHSGTLSGCSRRTGSLGQSATLP
eukprot:8929775-Lingulodinium_polyedra.AAC.1